MRRVILALALIVACAPPLQVQGWWVPAPMSSWQWQLQGTVSTAVVASVFDVDGFDVPAATVATLHGQGKKVICYISAGSWEDWRSDAGAFPESVKGSNNGWDGEKWLDIRQIAILAPIMTARMDMCVAKGFDALEPDNIDGYANNSGFPLTAADQLAYNRWLATEAHARGLGIGLKNDLDQVAALVPDFDFLIVEQCYQYQECGLTAPFRDAGKAIFAAEYRDKVPGKCANAVTRGMSLIEKRSSLNAWRQSCL